MDVTKPLVNQSWASNNELFASLGKVVHSRALMAWKDGDTITSEQLAASFKHFVEVMFGA